MDTATTYIYTYIHTLSLRDAHPVCLAVDALDHVARLQPGQVAVRQHQHAVVGAEVAAELLVDGGQVQAIPAERGHQSRHVTVLALACNAGADADDLVVHLGRYAGCGCEDRKSTRLNSSH